MKKNQKNHIKWALKCDKSSTKKCTKCEMGLTCMIENEII